MPQTPEDMFADKGYDGWHELSPRQKVERMLSIHKSGHEGEDVSLLSIIFSKCHVWIGIARFSALVTHIHVYKTQLPPVDTITRLLVFPDLRIHSSRKTNTLKIYVGIYKTDIDPSLSSASAQTSTKLSAFSMFPRLLPPLPL